MRIRFSLFIINSSFFSYFFLFIYLSVFISYLLRKVIGGRVIKLGGGSNRGYGIWVLLLLL
jgi:hypothetical protein